MRDSGQPQRRQRLGRVKARDDEALRHRDLLVGLHEVGGGQVHVGQRHAVDIATLNGTHVLKPVNVVDRQEAGLHARGVGSEACGQVPAQDRVHVEAQERATGQQAGVRRLNLGDDRAQRVGRKLDRVLLVARVGLHAGSRDLQHVQRNTEHTRHRLHREPARLQHLRVLGVHGGLGELRPATDHGHAVRLAVALVGRLKGILDRERLLRCQGRLRLDDSRDGRPAREEPRRELVERGGQPEGLLDLVEQRHALRLAGTAQHRQIDDLVAGDRLESIPAEVRAAVRRVERLHAHRVQRHEGDRLAEGVAEDAHHSAVGEQHRVDDLLDVILAGDVQVRLIYPQGLGTERQALPVGAEERVSGQRGDGVSEQPHTGVDGVHGEGGVVGDGVAGPRRGDEVSARTPHRLEADGTLLGATPE